MYKGSTARPFPARADARAQSQKKKKKSYNLQQAIRRAGKKNYFCVTKKHAHMEVALLIISVICFIAGFAGCILPALPGPPLSYVGMLLLQYSGYAHMSKTMLIVWAVVTVVICVADFFVTPLMTRRYGGSNVGSWGAVIGLVIGLFFSPWGPLVGPFLGALIGEIIVDSHDTRRALRAAWGSFLSFFVGTGLKLLVCGAMLANALWSL